MKFPRTQLSGHHGLVHVFARRLIPLLLIVVQADSESFQDTVGSELINRVDLQSDTLGELGDASIDVDAPETLSLAAPPKAHKATAAELALVQSKTTHKVLVHKEWKKESPDGDLKQAFASEEKPQDAHQVRKSFEASSKKEAKAADADVEELGGQLQNIMSELNAPAAPAAEKSQNSGKRVLEQASAMEDEAGMDADPTLDKEVAQAAKNSDSPKDDSEQVVDGAMAYIRTRLANEEHKSMRLRQLLAQSVRGNKNVRAKIDAYRKQLAEGAALQKSLRTVAAKKVAQEQAALAKETKVAQTATKELQNATRAANIGEKAMKFLGMRLKYAKSQVAALLLNLANSSQQNKNLKRHLSETNTTEVKEAKLLAETRKQAAAQAKELAETKAKLALLTKAKTAEDVQLKNLDRQKDFLEQRQSSATKRDAIIHKENKMLKSQLGTEIQREEQLREMWSKESEAFTWQLRAERANASESLADLEKARGEFKDLRDRVGKLRDRASHGEQSRHAAEEAANKAQFALAEAEAENKQLKGSVPWLEAEVDRQRVSANNATKQAQQALKERDTVKAILSEAQKNIVQLQGQYADALQALVVAQAGGTDTLNQQAPANSIQQFAGMAADPLGGPVPVSAPVGYDDNGGASLLELGRDSKALNNIMSTNSQASTRGRVDLSKDSGGLNALLRGMNNVH